MLEHRAVLLVFSCDEEGQQHADCLHKALQMTHPTLELVNGFDIFTADQYTPTLFHGGVVESCMNSWLSQCRPDRATTLSTTLPGELAKVATHFAKYVRGIQHRVEHAELQYNKERVYLLEAQVLSGVYGQFMRRSRRTQRAPFNSSAIGPTCTAKAVIVPVQ